MKEFLNNLRYIKKGQLISLILSLLITMGLISGIFLTQQKQLFQQKAYDSLSCDSWKSVKIFECGLKDYLSNPKGSACIIGTNYVKINNFEPTATEMRFINVPSNTYCNRVSTTDEGWSKWERYYPSLTWITPSGDGNKKVCAQYRNGSQTSAVCGAIITVDSTKMPQAPTGYHWEYVWGDEFNNDALDDNNKWNKLGPEERRDGWWVPENSYLDTNGSLVIKTNYNSSLKRYESGALNTQGKFEHVFGYFESRVNFHTQSGHWPSIWLMGNGVSQVGLDGTDGTEIDIFEKPWPINNDTVNHALHWDGYDQYHQSVSKQTNKPGVSKGWHNFGLFWKPDEYIFSIDGDSVWGTNAGGVSKSKEYLLITDEVGDWAGNISEASLPDYFYVDYVRVYNYFPNNKPECSSWNSVKIEDCQLDEWTQDPLPRDCLTASSNEVSMSLSSYAHKVRFINTDPEMNCSEISKNDPGWSDWKIYPLDSGVLRWPLSDGTGNKKVCVQFSNLYGESDICGAIIRKVPPCYSWDSVSLNNCSLDDWTSNPKSQDCYTNSSSVAVNNSSNEAEYVRYLNIAPEDGCLKYTDDNNSAWSDWSSYSRSNNWLLDSGSGDKKVCAQFKNYYGTSPACGAMITVNPELQTIRTADPTNTPTPTATVMPTNIPTSTPTPTPTPSSLPWYCRFIPCN